jgi:hypothetical protein
LVCVERERERELDWRDQARRRRADYWSELALRRAAS